MPQFDRQEKLKQMIARTTLVQGSDRRSELKAAFEESLAAAKDPDKIRDHQQYLDDLIGKVRAERKAKVVDGPAQLELESLRVTTIDNYLPASSNALSFFTSVNLADDEEPWIENTTRHNINVAYIGQDGRAKKSVAKRGDTKTSVDLYDISTDEFEYPVRDRYRGDMRTPATAHYDLADDLMHGIDAKLWPMIKAMVHGSGDTFGITGKKENRVYVPHANVVVANLPTTNLLVPSTTDGSSVWRKDCVDEIIKYQSKWGSGAFKDGELRAQTVFIPSSDLTGWLDSIDITSRENPLTKEIFEQGFVVNYGGTSLTLVGDNTLDPDDGLAYVQFNKPIGEFFTKTSQDQVFLDDGIANRKQNIETLQMQKVIGAALPSQWSVNIAAVQYRDAA